MRKGNGPSIKAMLLIYLAISKIIYWINIMPADFENAGRIIWERLLERDIVLIAVIVIMYFLEQKLKKRNRLLMHIILFVGGYVIFSITLIAFVFVLNLIRSIPTDIGAILLSPFMLRWTITFFIIMVVMTVKEYVKKKEASECALDIQSTDIELEMLKSLLDDGILSQEEFDKQKAKLLEV